MPHIDEMKPPSKYVSAKDLEDGDQDVRITKIAMEPMNDGKEKWIIYYRARNSFPGDQKGLALNQTNIMRISAQYGDHTDSWMGKTVTLTTEWTQDRAGKPVKGVRIKMPSGKHVLEDKGRYDTLKKAEPVEETGDDGQEIPW